VKRKINIILFLLVYMHTANAYGKEIINILPVTIQVVDTSGKPVANIVVYYTLITARPSVFLGIPNPFASHYYYYMTEKYYTDDDGKVIITAREVSLRSWEVILGEEIYVNVDLRYQTKLNQISNDVWKSEELVNPNPTYKGVSLWYVQPYKGPPGVYKPPNRDYAYNPMYVATLIKTEQPRENAIDAVIQLEKRVE
jgi:hypothetical protein